MSQKTSRVVRKLDEAEEELRIDLDVIELAKERAVVVDLLDKLDDMEKQKTQKVGELKRNIDSVQAEIDRTRKVIRDKFRIETMAVEYWLLASNEVIRIRKDNGEQFGPSRTATAAELQESLPLDSSPRQAPAPTPDPPVDSGFGDFEEPAVGDA